MRSSGELRTSTLVACSGAAAAAADAAAAEDDDTAASCEDDVDQRDVDGATLASKTRCCSPADVGDGVGDGVRYACAPVRVVPVGAVHFELTPTLWSSWSGKSEGAATDADTMVNDGDDGDNDEGEGDAFFFLRPAISSARIPRRIAGIALATSGPLRRRVCSPVVLSLVAVDDDDVFVASVTCLGMHVQLLLFLRRIPPTITLGEHVCAVDAPDEDIIREWWFIIDIYIYIYIYICM